MVMVLAPTKKKAQAMAEQRRRRDESGTAHAGHDVDEVHEAETVDLATALEADAVADAAEASAAETSVAETSTTDAADSQTTA